MPAVLENLCAMILTYNEERNLARTLDALKWAPRILIMDSFSTDRTLEIARAYPQVRIVQRKFDTFAGQCNFGLTQIQSEWVLSFDADYEATPELGEEIRSLTNPSANGYRASFVYCIYGRRLRGTLYPPRVVLYKRAAARYEDDGHAHHVRVEGTISDLKAKILHDDRKPLSVWLSSQDRYAGRELEKYRTTAAGGKLSRTDRLRKRMFVTPFLAAGYALFWKGLIFDGLPGFYYAFQRVIAEMILGMRLMEEKWLDDRQTETKQDPPEAPR